jgi:uncharacterized SAM-binding protein YcdF (DUF218 family)
MRKSKVLKIAKWLAALFGIWLLYLAISVFTFAASDLTEKADVAIVLGAAVVDNVPSPVFEERIKHAISLYQAGNVSKLIFTGGYGENKQFAESLVARDYALQQGIAAEAIMTETESHTTRQNLQQAQALLKRENISRSVIVSDPLHMKRAMMIADDIGLRATPSATPSSRYQSLKTKIPFVLREIYFFHHYLLFRE